MIIKKIAVSVIIAAVVSVFYWFHTFYFLENNFKDRLTTEERKGDLRIKILAIDSESLNQVGRWPWSRDILADVTEALIDNGAMAVWLDVLYTEESSHPEEDQAWQQLLSKHDNIYLPAYFEFKPRQLGDLPLEYDTLQRPVFEMEDTQLGHINVFEDRDRVVRRGMLGVPLDDGEMLPAISVRLANLLLADDEQITWNQKSGWSSGVEPLSVNERNEIMFSYASSPRESTFDVYPIHRVMNGDIPPNAFSGSVVLIGPYTVGLQDYYYTPMSKTLPMYGVEIHANLIQSLYDNSLFSEAGKPIGALVVFLTGLFSFFIIDRVRAKYSIFLALGLIILYAASFWASVAYATYMLPLMYPILAIMFAYITSIVWQYLAEQKEKKRVTGIFGRYVTQSVVDEILSSGEDIQVGGERKDVTLMFVDIRGFTPLSEKMEPEEVINILNEYLDLCTKAVFAYEGTIDKFMGDGVMAIFGAPIEQEDHAIRAAKAALHMKEKSDELSNRLQQKYGHAVAFGIGINSGPAVVGNIGSYDRLDYTAIGDTVNVAARLESNAKPNEVLLSESTYELIKDSFACEKLDPIKVKGKEHPVQVWCLSPPEKSCFTENVSRNVNVTQGL